MPMKNPPHPGGFVLRQCIEPLGLSITDSRRARRHADHALGTGEREARHLSRDGRAVVQGFRRQCRKLAGAAGAIRTGASRQQPNQAETAGTRLVSPPQAPRHGGVKYSRGAVHSRFLRIVSVVLACGLASAADFSLEDTHGKTYTSADLRQYKATVFIFVATDCPNSNTYAPVLARLYQEFSPRGIAFFNDIPIRLRPRYRCESMTRISRRPLRRFSIHIRFWRARRARDPRRKP